MEHTITQTEKRINELVYQIDGAPEWTLVGKRIHTIRPGHIKLFRNGVLQYELKQENLLRQIFSCLK